MSFTPSASARRRAAVDMRPPLVRLMVDLRLSNPGDARRWFLVPDAISSAVQVGPVNGASVTELVGSGRVPLAHFEGQGGFFALLLEGGASVRLRDVSVDSDFEEPSHVLTIVAAAAVVVGDRPAAAWYDVDPVCDAEANASAADGRFVGERYPEDNPELEVGLQDALELTVDLGATGD